MNVWEVETLTVGKELTLNAAWWTALGGTSLQRSEGRGVPYSTPMNNLTGLERPISADSDITLPDARSGREMDEWG